MLEDVEKGWKKFQVKGGCNIKPFVTFFNILKPLLT